MSDPRGRAHLNTIDSSRQLFELDPGAKIEVGEGWLFGAGSAANPAISNAAFRSDDELDPAELIERARAFFDPLGRGFSLWVRGEEPEDESLAATAEACGMKRIYAMPEMLLHQRPEERDLPDGVRLRRVESDEDAVQYWRIAKASYESIGFPPEVFGHYTDAAGLWAENAVAFLAELDGEPAAIAMTLVSHGVAGIFWVGTLEAARGKGVGRAITAAATNAGFELGADLASLQASPMGESIYAAMGYERIHDYRLLLSAPPEGAT